MQTVTGQDLEALKQQHPGRHLIRLKSKSAEVIAKVPTSAEIGPLREKLHDPKLIGSSTEWFVRACIVHPPPNSPELNAILEPKPLLIEKWSKALQAAAGGDEEVEVENL